MANNLYSQQPSRMASGLASKEPTIEERPTTPSEVDDLGESRHFKVKMILILSQDFHCTKHS